MEETFLDNNTRTGPNDVEMGLLVEMQQQLADISVQTQNLLVRQNQEMDAKLADFKREMLETRATQQQILTKLSALSKSHAKAPAIFEGADRRIAERHAAEQRRGKSTVLPAVVSSTQPASFYEFLYPMWLVPGKPHKSYL